VLIDINLEKIKSENEAAQLREQLIKKNKEIDVIAKELVTVRRENKMLKGLVEDLQKELNDKKTKSTNELYINKLNNSKESFRNPKKVVANIEDTGFYIQSEREDDFWSEKIKDVSEDNLKGMSMLLMSS